MNQPSSVLRLRHSISLCLAAFVIFASGLATAAADTFVFGSGGNDLLGATSKTLHAGAFAMDLVAGPAGAGLWESAGVGGMGVDASAILGPGGLAARFDRLNGVSEFVEFSFDTPGILTGINFDGVKDESFEYFVLESTGGLRISFFDSAANITIPGAIDNAISHGVVTGQVVYLLEGNGFDDEVNDLSIPFSAGQVFRLTYAEVGGGLGATFEPTLAPNGARLQGLTVAAVPEPGTLTLAVTACGFLIGTCLARKRALRFR